MTTIVAAMNRMGEVLFATEVGEGWVEIPVDRIGWGDAIAVAEGNTEGIIVGNAEGIG